MGLSCHYTIFSHQVKLHKNPTFNMNMTIQNGHFRIKVMNKDVPNEELNILIKCIH